MNTYYYLPVYHHECVSILRSSNPEGYNAYCFTKTTPIEAESYLKYTMVMIHFQSLSFQMESILSVVVPQRPFDDGTQRTVAKLSKGR